MKKFTLLGAFLLLCSASFSQTIDENGTLTFWPDAPKDVVIPEGVKRVAKKAFWDCLNTIESVKTPASLEVFEDQVFFGAGNLKKVELNEGLKDIGVECFCFASIEELTIPNSVDTIRATAFAECINLKKVYIGSGVTSLSTVFDCSQNITEMVISPENPYIEMVGNAVITKDGKTFEHYMGLKDVEEYAIPDGVETVLRYAFHNEQYLKKLTVPSSVVSLGRLCFWNCTNLKDVVIGKCENLVLDPGVFSKDTLTTLTIEAVNPPAYDDTSFGGTEDLLGQHECTLYIPEESWKAYESDGYFSYFKAVEPIKGVSIEDVYTDQNDLSVSYENGNIYITVENAGCYPVEIFSLSGTLVYRGSLNGNQLTLPANQFGCGLYAVAVGNKTVKLVIPNI